MALRSLMLTKSINEKRSALEALEAVDFQTREAEIAAAIEEAASDEERSTVEEAITAFEAEKTETETKKENLRSEIAALEADLAEIEAAAPAETGEIEKPIEERKDDKPMEIRSTKEYIDAFVDYIKTEDDMKCRALLTENADTTGLSNVSGPVPVPTYVEGRIRQAWEKNEILSRVRKTYLPGNVKIGFEVSASAAAVHAEGATRPDEEQLVLGVINLIPSSIKKWITISDEAMDMGGTEFLDYVYDELTYQIALYAANAIVGSIAAAPDALSYTAGDPAPQAVTQEALALGTVAAAIANLSDQAVDPVVIMNKGTWAALKALQYAGGYAVDPFEGLPVLFTSTLGAYADASEDDVYMIVGDLGVGVTANFPNGQQVKIKYDDLSLAEYDLVKLVGRMFIALGVVAPNAFCRVTKPAEDGED